MKTSIFLPRTFTVILSLFVALICSLLSPSSRAADGAVGTVSNGNTAEGSGALAKLTTGFFNTAMGFDALNVNTTGFDNTATGTSALAGNTKGVDNTATGYLALTFNISGSENTATGVAALEGNSAGYNNTATGSDALFNNTTGHDNTATGVAALFGQSFKSTGSNNTATGSQALENNITGGNNTATGVSALLSNNTGTDNTATGLNALNRNTSGGDNTATGVGALGHNMTGTSNTAEGHNALNMSTGNFNTAIGDSALLNTTGTENIAVGVAAGENLTTGSNNIDIGNGGMSADANTIRVGTEGTHTATYLAGISGATVPSGVAVIIDSTGHLGTTKSSARFKQAIKPMDKASESILSLKPVTFRYKKDIDPDGIPQFGLVAEDVEKVNPDLVVRDEQGKVYTVRYEAVNAMLLNEFLKEHCKVETQEATIEQQQQEIAALAAQLKEQAALIRKVSDRLEAGKPAPQLVANN